MPSTPSEESGPVSPPTGQALPEPVHGLVSVIVIFHNEQAYLRQAIGSVCAQTYEHWELLLVDDGSHDQSTAYARSACAGDQQRIRYLTHPNRANRGMSVSRNLGLAQARGEFIAFVDGDDVFLPNRLEHHVNILRQFPAMAMVQSDHIRWRSHALANGGAGGDYLHDQVRPFLSVGDQVLWPPLALQRILAVPYLAAGICNITVRRRIALQVGGFVDAFSSLYEDQAFIARISLEHPVYVLQAYQACYRHHRASATRKVSNAGKAGRLAQDQYSREYFDWLIRLLETRPIRDNSELLAMARARRTALQPTLWRRLGRTLSAHGLGLLEKALPTPWFAALQDLGRRHDGWNGARAYAGLARTLTERAKAGALRSMPASPGDHQHAGQGEGRR